MRILNFRQLRGECNKPPWADCTFGMDDEDEENEMSDRIVEVSLNKLNAAKELIDQATEDDPLFEEVGETLLECLNWFLKGVHNDPSEDSELFNQGTIDYYICLAGLLYTWLNNAYGSFDEVKADVQHDVEYMIRQIQL